MRILVDTNVVLDFIKLREPFYECSAAVLLACRDRVVHGVIAAHSIADMFFILRRDFSADERRQILLKVCQIMDVEAIDKEKLIYALANMNFSDFEDCLQAECAVSCAADYIVTRNVKDYRLSPITAVTPEEFCKKVINN